MDGLNIFHDAENQVIMIAYDLNSNSVRLANERLKNRNTLSKMRVARARKNNKRNFTLDVFRVENLNRIFWRNHLIAGPQFHAFHSSRFSYFRRLVNNFLFSVSMFKKNMSFPSLRTKIHDKLDIVNDDIKILENHCHFFLFFIYFSNFYFIRSMKKNTSN